MKMWRIWGNAKYSHTVFANDHLLAMILIACFPLCKLENVIFDLISARVPEDKHFFDVEMQPVGINGHSGSELHQSLIFSSRRTIAGNVLTSNHFMQKWTRFLKIWFIFAWNGLRSVHFQQLFSLRRKSSSGAIQTLSDHWFQLAAFQRQKNVCLRGHEQILNQIWHFPICKEENKQLKSLQAGDHWQTLYGNILHFLKSFTFSLFLPHHSTLFGYLWNSQSYCFSSKILSLSRLPDFFLF